MMKKIVCILLLILSFSQINAQQIDNTKSGKKYLPAQVSLFYPIGTSGQASYLYNYNFSLNVLYGQTGGINGIEIGGLAGLARGNVRGMQVNGLLSFANNLTGLQIGGLIGATDNLNGMQANGLIGMADDVLGLQINGLIGMANNTNGMQVTGVIGLANDAQGLQLAGLMGIANNIRGAQIAGGMSIGNNINGLQLGGLINIANEVDGTQIAGIANRTNKLRGFQLALVNITDTVEHGVPMGLISIVKRGGYHQWEIYSSDIVNAGASYKLGIRKFYSIYSVGYNFIEDQLLVAGFGFGSNFPIDNKYEFQPELVSYSYLPTDFKDIRYTTAIQLKLGFVRKFGKTGVLIAPTIYWSMGDNKNSQYGYKISPISPLYTHTSNNNKQSIGIGYTIGITL